MLPVTAALIAFSPDLEVALLGRAWRDAGGLVQVIAIYGLARAFGVLPIVLANALGCPQLMLITTSLALVFPLSLAWPLFRSANLIGLAWAFTIGQLVCCFVATLPSLSLLRRVVSSKHLLPFFSTVISLVFATLLMPVVGPVAALLLFGCFFFFVEIGVDRAFRAQLSSVVLMRKPA
jgi:O-antigen/teichoic acid export membrane protein